MHRNSFAQKIKVPLPVARASYACELVNIGGQDTVVVAGGYTYGSDAMTSILLLDASTLGTWITGPPYPMPIRNMGSTVIEGKMVTIGGKNG